jgi:hypothetical protein
MAPPRGKFQTKLNAVMFSMLLEELMAGPATAQEIAEYTGMSVLTVQRTLRVMHRRGVIHIKSWGRDIRGAWTLRAWKLGEGKDAPKPPPNSSGGTCKAKARDRMVHAALAGVSA